MGGSSKIVADVENSTNTTAKSLNEQPTRKRKLQKYAIQASWVVNWILIVIKMVAFFSSYSKSVGASLADSGVDLISQFVLSLASHYKSKKSDDYPIGRSKLDDLGVLCCAGIMIMASVEIIQSSVGEIYEGVVGVPPESSRDILAASILGAGTLLKAILFLFCDWVNKKDPSDMLAALTEDHLNDVMSNAVAIIAIVICMEVKNSWWVDPSGAVLISLVITWRWYVIIKEQVKKIVGLKAEETFIDEIRGLCYDHGMQPQISSCDVTAYHYGAKYFTEILLHLAPRMTVSDVCAIKERIKLAIDLREDIERCHILVGNAQTTEIKTKETNANDANSIVVASPQYSSRHSSKRRSVALVKGNSFFHTSGKAWQQEDV